MLIEMGNYQIRGEVQKSYWEIFKYQEVTPNRGPNKGITRMDWVSTGYYPTNLGRAVQIVYEMMLHESDEALDLAGAVRKCGDTYKLALESVNKAIKEVEQ